MSATWRPRAELQPGPGAPGVTLCPSRSADLDVFFWTEAQLEGVSIRDGGVEARTRPSAVPGAPSVAITWKAVCA